MNKANIGSRWQPGERVCIDTSGCYEHINGRVYIDDDSLQLQRALLAPPPPGGNGRIRSALLAIVIAIALAAAAFYGGSVA